MIMSRTMFATLNKEDVRKTSQRNFSVKLISIACQEEEGTC